MKINYVKDECYPIYFLTDEKKFSDGKLDLPEDFITEFNDIADRFWNLQAEIDDLVEDK